MSETEEVCGETYDHKLRLIDERDGAATWECTECGGEIIEDTTLDDGDHA